MLLDWQRKTHRRPAKRVVLGNNMSSMVLNEKFGDIQSQTGMPFCLEECT